MKLTHNFSEPFDTVIGEQLELQEWYHGRISRPESEELIIEDGDFLVRESRGHLGNYILTGKQGTFCRHFELVDPEGRIRTRDRIYDSVTHMVRFHQENQLPIVFGEYALLLKTPVKSLNKQANNKG